MKKFGKYPWSVRQYTDFIWDVTRDVKLDFGAIMDYACEPSVNREIYRSNKERIKVTVRNEAECMRVAPDLPWLPVLQGDSLTEGGIGDGGRKIKTGRLNTSSVQGSRIPN